MPGRMRGPGSAGECDFMMVALWICHLLRLFLAVWVHVRRKRHWVGLAFKFHQVAEIEEWARNLGCG